MERPVRDLTGRQLRLLAPVSGGDDRYLWDIYGSRAGGLRYRLPRPIDVNICNKVTAINFFAIKLI